jgi:hypothetical protein
MHNKIIAENIYKNLIILVLLAVFYLPLKTFLVSLRSTDYDSVILAANLMIVAFLFADYAFTYSASDLTKSKGRYLDHAVAGICIFGTGALLEVSTVALNLKLGANFLLFDLVATLFYISLVLYDFWDLKRGLQKYS